MSRKKALDKPFDQTGQLSPPLRAHFLHLFSSFHTRPAGDVRQESLDKSSTAEPAFTCPLSTPLQLPRLPRQAWLCCQSVEHLPKPSCTMSPACLVWMVWKVRKGGQGKGSLAALLLQSGQGIRQGSLRIA